MANDQAKEAVSLLEDQDAVYDSIGLPAEHPARLSSQQDLADAYLANGQSRDAVQLLECMTEIFEQVFDEDDPARLAFEERLASARADRQRWTTQCPTS